MPTIFDDLCLVAKTKPKPGEAFDDFAQRVYEKAQKLDDKSEGNKLGWDSLSEAAQNWVNDCVLVFEQRSALRKEGKAEEAAAVAIPEMEGFEVVLVKGGAEPTVGEQIPMHNPPPKAKGKARKPPTTKKAAAPKAKAKALNGPQKPGKEGGAKRGRRSLFADTGKIKILVRDNPHRLGSYRDRNFKKIKSGMTVAEAVKAGCPRQQIWSMLSRQVISIT